MRDVESPSEGWERRRPVLSALWLFAMLNYLYADVMSLMNAPTLRQFLAGQVGAIEVTPLFLVGAAFLMEIPIAMTLLARVLPYKANRPANIIIGAFKFLVTVLSLFAGKPIPFYMVFIACELACTAFIIWYAWTWPAPAGDAPQSQEAGVTHGNE